MPDLVGSGGFADAAAELVEVVDSEGRVERVVSRAEMRAQNLCHRCTYVFVVTLSDELVVHQRAPWKDIAPSYWDICFGGVVDVGEAWEAAALRELQEEAGLVPALRLVPLGEVVYSDEQTRLIGRAFVMRSDESPSCPDGEVVAVDMVPLSELTEWSEAREVCPDSLESALPLLTKWISGQS